MRAPAVALGRRLPRLPLPRRLALPPASPRLVRVLLVACLILLATAAGYRFWLRDSSFVAVDDVTVTGLTTKDAPRVRAALTSAARSMTTLHVDRDTLDHVVSVYPVVRQLQVTADFPHGLTIHVVEHRPAALAHLGEERIPVAGDGTLLRGLPVEGRLPAIEGQGGVEGNRLSGRWVLEEARVAGAAPLPLRPRVERVTTRSGDGIVVELRDGPELIFGSATRARAKWLAAARVLADPDAEGASYIDVRLPGRPAAGGLPAETLEPVAPAGDTAYSAPATGTPAATSTPTASADPAQAPATGTTPATTGVVPDTTAGETPAATPTPAAPTDPTATTDTPADGTGAGAVAAP